MVVKKLIIAVLLSVGCFQAEGLELNRVILSSNNAAGYLEFWPVIAPLWTAMGFRPTLALIADESCIVDTSIGDVIRFDPIPGISEALHAQVIRLFLPAFFPEDGCLISDIDMLPISESYFREGAIDCPEEAFLVYRDGAYGVSERRFPMCYLAGKGSVFASLCRIERLEDVETRIFEWAAHGLGWDTDELVLFIEAMKWEERGGQIVRLGHGVGPRLDRGDWGFDLSELDISAYIDCHCPRPYSGYKDKIDEIAHQIYLEIERRSQSFCH